MLCKFAAQARGRVKVLFILCVLIVRLLVMLTDAELSVCELLQELLQQERAAVCSEVREEDIDRSHLHTVVRDFLVAHAYEDTLSHFDHAYSQRALPCLCALCSFF